jgi:uncharacterized protein YnzC (UPF0291/DUF896 family)
MDLTLGLGSLIGGIVNAGAQRDTNAANVAMQKEFAQKGIQWKVNDAKAAGVHPLAALGAQTHSPNIPLQNPRPGEAFENAIRTYQSASEKELKEKELDAQKAEADVRKRLAEAQINNLNKQTSTLGEPENLYVPYKDKDGSIKYFVHPDVGESMDSLGANALNLRGFFMEPSVNEVSQKQQQENLSNWLKNQPRKWTRKQYMQKFCKQVKYKTSDGTGRYVTRTKIVCKHPWEKK